MFDVPPTILPRVWTLENYIFLLKATKFILYFRNSLIVCLSASLVAIVIAIVGVYSLSRFKFRFSGLIGFSILFSYMLPQIMIIIPFTRMLVTINATNSILSLAFVFISITLPFALWMLRSYIETIPRELEEAAMVDGASRFKAFIKIIIPAALPGLMATLIFTFIVSWNEYVYSLILISSETKKTVSLGLGLLARGQEAIFSYGMLAAGSVLAVIPLLVMFVFVQRRLVSGFTAGAMKG